MHVGEREKNMYDREDARNAFLSYARQYDTENILIRHKIAHTFRVAEFSERYAKALDLGTEDVDFAWLLGLLHDIGRFEQARRYGTFVDSQSTDHAELSADVLFKDGLIDSFPSEGLPENWRMIAEFAVRWHNKLSLPDNLDERTLMFAQLLRDADKTDIFRVIADIPFKDRAGSSLASFQETEEAGPEVMDCVLEHRCVPKRLVHSRFEGRIMHCCMAFELVYKISRMTVREEGFLLSLLAKTDAQGKQIWTDKETKQLQILRREIENAWGFSLDERNSEEVRL